MAEQFWQRWTKENLTTLQRQKWLHPQRNFQVGNIVLLVDSSASRNTWPMRISEHVHVGNQKLIRSVKMRTKTVTLVRSISKLCLLLEKLHSFFFNFLSICFACNCILVFSISVTVTLIIYFFMIILHQKQIVLNILLVLIFHAFGRHSQFLSGINLFYMTT